MNVEARLLQVVSQLTENDLIINRFDLAHDESYPYRLATAGYGITAVLRARQAYEESAVSYRGKNVGCAAVAFDTKRNRVGIFTGANIKVDGTDLVNIHAEDVSLYKTEVNNFDVWGLLAVVGTPQEDHLSGQQSTTLHSCGKCRPKIAASKMVTRHTQLLSATPSLEYIEAYDIHGLQAFHDNQDTTGVASFQLLPEAKDWDDTVGVYLRDKVVGMLTKVEI